MNASHLQRPGRRALLARTATFLAAAMLTGGAAAQGYPSKPVTLLVPYPAGGLSDVIARMVEKPFAKAIGQMAVVDNLGGASGSIAAQKVLNSPAEGKPLSYASVGVGSLYHFVGANFAHTIGAQMTHVPYKGLAPALQDLGGNLVDVAFLVVDSRLPGFVDQGMFKVLATMAPSGKPEAKFLEKYPSINDSKAIKDFAFDAWTGYFVRKDTPENVVAALNRGLATAMNDPEARKKLEDLGGRVPPMMSVADAQREFERQTARFRAIARNIKLEAL
jgi:tripartite-type tricarboxylate transporter receptor subunit TctC